MTKADGGARIEETLKFLKMAAFCDGNNPVSQEIDDVWHLRSLETRECGRFCACLEGRTFIHHSSSLCAAFGNDSGESCEDDLEHDVAALANYVLNYGPFEPDRVRYWPLAAHLVDSCSMDVQQLNAWLTIDAAVIDVSA